MYDFGHTVHSPPSVLIQVWVPGLMYYSTGNTCTGQKTKGELFYRMFHCFYSNSAGIIKEYRNESQQGDVGNICLCAYVSALLSVSYKVKLMI